MSITSSVVILCVVFAQAWGFFNDGVDPESDGPGSLINGTLIQCAVDLGQTFHNPLNLDRRNSTQTVFRPFPSGYQYPGQLEDGLSAGAILGLMKNLNINPRRQNVFLPNTDILGLRGRYDTGNDTDSRILEELCGNDVLANTSMSERHRDQVIFTELRNQVQEEWLNIWNNLTTERQEEIMTYNDGDLIDIVTQFTNDILAQFQDTMNALSCDVAFKWEDAGPSFFPRYFYGGFCFDRECSLPNKPSFRCQADLSDLSPGGINTLEVARWDCCWQYNVQNKEYEFVCGFRKVTFSTICDCDCRCRDVADV